MICCTNNTYIILDAIECIVASLIEINHTNNENTCIFILYMYSVWSQSHMMFSDDEVKNSGNKLNLLDKLIFKRSYRNTSIGVWRKISNLSVIINQAEIKICPNTVLWFHDVVLHRMYRFFAGIWRHINRRRCPYMPPLVHMKSFVVVPN